MNQNLSRRWLLPVMFPLCLTLSACLSQHSRDDAPESVTTTERPAVAASLPELSTPSSEPVLAGYAIARADVAPQLDFWQRLAEGYQWPQCDYSPEAQRWAEYYGNNHELTDRILERAEPWLLLILERIEARELPHELIFVPAIESAFYPFAYSHGRAAGLWQFVAATARQQKLSIDWWYDGRRDVLASTDAALDYFEYLSSRFDGNWSLALSAYNAGQGRVTRSLRQNRSEAADTPAHQLSLPRETRAYVPKIMGFACLMNDPQRFGYQRPALSTASRLAVIEAEQPLLLPRIAEVSGMSMPDFQSINPGFNRWVTPPAGPHRAVIPIEQLDAVQTALDAGELFDDIRWQRHRVQRGDTLGGIARRYGVPIQVVRDVNQLGQSSMIRAGSHLLIPIPDQDGALELGERLAGLGVEHSVVSHYEVQSGDSLWRISRSMGVSIADLQRWNGLGDNAVLRPGQTLRIQSAQASSSTLSEASRHRTIQYRVRNGDSLWTIGRRFGVSPGQIRQWNNLSGDVLQPGQSLQLVVDLLTASS